MLTGLESEEVGMTAQVQVQFPGLLMVLKVQPATVRQVHKGPVR